MTRLKAWREAQGYSLRELADVTGKSVATLSRTERGLTNLSAGDKIQVARALGVPVHVLFAPGDNQLSVSA